MDICRKYVELRDKIKHIRVAMLTVHGSKGSLRSMPMITVQTDCEGYVWFFTNLESEKVEEIKRDPSVNVSYTDQAAQVYVSISGRAEIVEDRGRIEEYWKPSMQEWFPEGLESSDLALLKIEMLQAEYWNGKNMVQIWDMTDAVKPTGMIPDDIYS